MEKNLTTGSVWKNIIYFSIPYFFSYFLQTLYGMADLFIIGQFNGVESITAVSVGSQVMHMLTVMIVGLAMGSTVMIGRAIGASKKEEAGKIIGNTVSLFMIVAIALTIGLVFCVKPIVALMSTPEEAIAGTTAYLTICFIGIPFITLYNVISSIFRGLGDSKSPMYFIAIACVVNIGLDYLFIGALQMGAAGAALGTTLAQTVSVCVALWKILKQNAGLKLKKSDFRLNRSVLEDVLKIGVPVAAQDGFIQISFIVVTIIANRRGLSDAAAVGIVEKIIGIVFLVPSTMLSTVSALSAQNIGAGKHKRASRTLRYGICITVTYGILVALAVQLNPEMLIGLFTSEKNVEVIQMGSQYIRGYIFDCVFAGIHFSFSGYFCAYGKSGISFLHNFLSIVLVRVPGAFLASKLFADTLLPMGFASTCGSALSVTVCVIAYIYLKKKGNLGNEKTGKN